MSESVVAGVPSPAVVAVLAAARPGELSRDGLVDLVAGLERCVGWLQSLQLAALAELADRSLPDDDGVDREWVREDVALALRLSSATAGLRLELARGVRRVPRTAALLSRGEVTLHHARALVDAVRPLPDAVALVVDERVADRAAAQSLAAFTRSVARAVLAVDARGADERHRSRRAERRVVFTPIADGMTELWALLPAEQAATVKAALDALAARAEVVKSPDRRLPALPVTDGRSKDQRRADALTEMARSVLHGASGIDLPAAHGLRPAVQVTVALSTLLGLDDQPGDLSGYGPIPAELARRLADDPSGTWRRLVTDHTGRLLDYGRTTYRPPTALARKVIARDRTCTFPHCHAPAVTCDLDHHHPWHHGGTTSETNLGALCRRHHRLKHHQQWTVRRTTTGDTLWTSRTGRRHTRPAATYPADLTLGPWTHTPPDGTGPEQDGTDNDPPPF